MHVPISTASSICCPPPRVGPVGEALYERRVHVSTTSFLRRVPSLAFSHVK